MIIVGAGQAGLALAGALQSRGMTAQQDFVVVDEASHGNRAWALRRQSMTLVSDARRSALPYRMFPGDPSRRIRSDEMADYLTVVEAALGVVPIWGVRATGVERRGSGSTLELSTTAGDVQTRNIVCATGWSRTPRIPEWTARVTVPGVVVHSGDYRGPDDVPPGDVLIVGAGDSGIELARELRSSHAVSLAVRQPDRTRVKPRYRHAIEGLRRSGVAVLPAVADARGAAVTFADGTRRAPTSVILATGYRPGDDWLPSEVTPVRGRAGRTSMSGLYVAGMPRFSRPRADTIAGSWRDASTIAHHITNRP